MREIWKDCKGYEGLYQVSNLGRVWSVRRQKYMSSAFVGSDYLAVHLTAKNGKHKLEYVHRLVALAFLENPNHYPQVNHKDEDKTNNCVDNLEWCTAKYNMNYGSAKYAQAKRVAAYDKETNTVKTYNSMVEAAKDTGVSISMISQCCNNIKQQKRYIWYFITEE